MLLSKRERVRRALAHEEVDRLPYSFWRHFPNIDLDPVTLLDETVRFARKLDLDFVKAMSNGLYCVEDWGAVADYSAIHAGGVARVARHPVVQVDDWRRVQRLPTTATALARELGHLANLVVALGPDVPVLATVYSPLTIAHKLAGAALDRDVREAPEAVLNALEAITLTTADFVQQALAVGCAGVFFAAQDANPARFNATAYARFGEPFDRRVLRAAAPGWFNILHMHGSRVLFDSLKVYPVAALNWHIGEAPPSVAAYRRAGGRLPIVGGLRRSALTQRNSEAVSTDLLAIKAETAGRGILLAPGCVIREPVDMDFLQRVATQIAHGGALV